MGKVIYVNFSGPKPGKIIDTVGISVEDIDEEEDNESCFEDEEIK